MILLVDRRSTYFVRLVIFSPHDQSFILCILQGMQMTPELCQQLKNAVRQQIGPLATPAYIQLAPGLPKTRSGKITRRILRKVAEGNVEADLGDVSTLADETVSFWAWSFALQVSNL